MTDLRLLLKLQGINIFRLNEIRFTKDKKQKRRLSGMLVLYVLLSFMSIVYASLMAWALAQGGLSLLMPSFALLLSTAVCLMLSLIRAPGLFFNPKGWDTLLALPFPRYALTGAKLFNLYMSALSAALIIVVPYAVFYSFSSGFHLFTSLVWLCIALFAPLLPMALGIIIAAIPTLLLQRLKSRSLLFAVLMLPFITWLMLKAYTLPIDSLEDIGLMSNLLQELERSFLSIYPPLGWIMQAIQGQWAGLWKFIALNMMLILGVSLLLSIFLPHLQQAMGSISLRGAKHKQSPVLKPLWALILKEARRMASSSLYLLNTGLGLWMTPMALFLLPFVKPGIIQTLIAVPMAQDIIGRYLPLMASALCAIAVPATVSISIEGKNAWIMCTAPVSSTITLLSKLLFSILFCLPPLLLTALLLAVHLHLNFWMALVCFLLPLSLCTFSSAVGLMLDLRFARFDWDNEQQIIKNSAQSGLVALTVFLMLGFLFAALFFAPQGSTLWLSYGMAAIIFLSSAAIMKLLFKTAIYQIK